jgi:hypothetical protein
MSQNVSCIASGAISLTVGWTDQGVARSVTPSSGSLALSMSNGTGTNANTASGQIVMNLAASSSVTWSTTVQNGGCTTSSAYNVYTTLERIM